MRFEGPLSVPDYVTACLHDPEFGYYSHNVDWSGVGDFLTAPRVSQMFGEMIGVWLLETWERLGQPASFSLVEIGGGDGTLMKDILRTARLAPDFLKAAHLVMIEASSRLRQVQKNALITNPVEFISQISELKSDLPFLIVSNEWLDCLPAYQYVGHQGRWFERRINVDTEGQFGYVLAQPVTLEIPVKDGAILEISPAQDAVISDITDRLKSEVGAALFIDYGRAEPGFGDTLQAIRNHVKGDPLSQPGEYDLTQWVDFPSLGRILVSEGLEDRYFTTQAAFLHTMGIEARYNDLISKNPDHCERLTRQYDRLMASDQMGDLFKVFGMVSPGSIELPGFF